MRRKSNHLIEQRDELRIALTKAFANNEFDKYDRLNCRLIKLDKKIRKGKK